MTRSVHNFRRNWLAAAADPPAVESSAIPCDRAASFEAATMSHKTMSYEAAALKAASVGACVIWMSPAVVPGACADKDPAREPTRTVVAVGRASIRIVRVIAVSADRRASHNAADADPHSDARSNNDLSL